MVIICGLSGIGNSIVGPIFSVDTKNFNMPTSTFTNMSSFNNIPSADRIGPGSNISAGSIQLADSYSFYIWSYSTTIGSQTNYSSSSFNYISKINISTITTADTTTIEVPQPFIALKKTLKNLIQFAEAVLIVAVFNCTLLLGTGIAACFGLKCHPVIMYFLNGVVLSTIVIFAADITAAGEVTVSNLHVFKAFGADSKMGTTVLAIVWLAVAHMVAVCAMWLLMAFGKMQMNSAVKSSRPGERSASHSESTDLEYLSSKTDRRIRASETHTQELLMAR